MEIVNKKGNVGMYMRVGNIEQLDYYIDEKIENILADHGPCRRRCHCRCQIGPDLAFATNPLRTMNCRIQKED